MMLIHPANWLPKPVSGCFEKSYYFLRGLRGHCAMQTGSESNLPSVMLCSGPALRLVPTLRLRARPQQLKLSLANHLSLLAAACSVRVPTSQPSPESRRVIELCPPASKPRDFHTKIFPDRWVWLVLPEPAFEREVRGIRFCIL